MVLNGDIGFAIEMGVVSQCYIVGHEGVHLKVGYSLVKHLELM